MTVTTSVFPSTWSVRVGKLRRRQKGSVRHTVPPTGGYGQRGLERTKPLNPEIVQSPTLPSSPLSEGYGKGTERGRLEDIGRTPRRGHCDRGAERESSESTLTDDRWIKDSWRSREQRTFLSKVIEENSVKVKRLSWHGLNLLLPFSRFFH